MNAAVTKPQRRVLLVEDERALARTLGDLLHSEGYRVETHGDGVRALDAASEGVHDLILLDVMLPKLDGFGVLRELRRTQPTLPVIMVTARGAEEDRVRGLADGADDYVIKPFSARELLARVEAVLRRSPQRAGAVTILRAGDRTMHLQRREVTQPGAESRQLTDREVEILRYLAANRGRAIDRSELLRHVWGLNPRGIQTRTVDMHIARLREKLTNGAASEPTILTVRGKGYMLAHGVTVGSS